MLARRFCELSFNYYSRSYNFVPHSLACADMNLFYPQSPSSKEKGCVACWDDVYPSRVFFILDEDFSCV